MAETPADAPTEISTGPIVVRAWAPWCGSCRALAPHVNRIAAESGVPVFDLQIDDDPRQLVDALAVRSVPTLIGLRDGVEVGRLVGAQSIANLDRFFAMVHSGDGAVGDVAPISMVAARAVVGALLVVTGILLGSTALWVIGAGLTAWSLTSLLRGRT